MAYEFSDGRVLTFLTAILESKRYWSIEVQYRPPHTPVLLPCGGLSHATIGEGGDDDDDDDGNNNNNNKATLMQLASPSPGDPSLCSYPSSIHRLLTCAPSRGAKASNCFHMVG